MLHWSDGDVWSRCEPDPANKRRRVGVLYLEGNPERRRLEREAFERAKDKETEAKEEADFYIGKSHLPPSWGGGGWGGPKEGNDTDEMFMLRGEARELPDDAYRAWRDRNKVKHIIEEKMVGRAKFSSLAFGSKVKVDAKPKSSSESDAAPANEETKKKQQQAERMEEYRMEAFRERDDLKKYFDNAYGWAVFANVAKAGLGVGGAVGKGKVYVSKPGTIGHHVGNSTLVQLSVGFQFGGQVYSQIVFFEDDVAFNKFTNGDFQFGADASAVALTASASAKASTMGNQDPSYGLSSEEQTMKELPPSLRFSTQRGKYTNGMAVFTSVAGGLMYEATVSGQKFDYKPLGNEFQ